MSNRKVAYGEKENQKVMISIFNVVSDWQIARA